jgi:Leucine-rich repeat (LRR) protein
MFDHSSYRCSGITFGFSLASHPRCFAGMEEHEGSFFNRLPKDTAEALLRQAWQQLDNWDRFGTVPRVCRSWLHLSLPTFTSLELSLMDYPSAEEFPAWLRRHGSTLQHLYVDAAHMESWSFKLLSQVLDGIHTCKSLTSLHLVAWDGPTTLSEQLLTQLTSLSVRCLAVQEFDFYQLCRHDMRQLRVLDLHGTESCPVMEESRVPQFLSALPNLTSLDLTKTPIRLEHLASCRSLPPLQELELSMACDLKSHNALAVLEATGQLRDLTLTAWRNEGVKDLALLTGLTQLTSLSITYAGPADADVVSPLKALSNLQQLTVDGFSKRQADAVRAAVAAKQLPCLIRFETMELYYAVMMPRLKELGSWPA